MEGFKSRFSCEICHMRDDQKWIAKFDGAADIMERLVGLAVRGDARLRCSHFKPSLLLDSASPCFALLVFAWISMECSEMDRTF
jgi:hypothetical protein